MAIDTIRKESEALRRDQENQEAGNPEYTTIVTPPQLPKPRRFKRKMVEDSNRNASKVSRVGLSQAQTPVKVITPPQVTNTPISPRHDDLSKKMTRVSHGLPLWNSSLLYRSCDFDSLID